VRQQGLDQEPTPQVFLDLRQLPQVPPGAPPVAAVEYFAVRTEGPPSVMVSSIRDIVRQLEPMATVERVATMEQLVSNSVARPRLYAVLLGAFAAVAVALAAIGIYGVLTYAVSQRIREIGIRMALGAERSNVMRLVLGQSLVLTVIGIVVGLGGAATVSRYLETMLFGLTPLDRTTFVAVALVFAAVATVAAYVPARRATHVDPVVALRND
jgi:putative ABC transport system permease protein